MLRSARILLVLTLAAAATLASAAGAHAVTPQIASNYSTVCTLSDAGAVRCAGYNFDGELGIGNQSTVLGFVTPQISDVTQLASSDYSTCALKTDTSVWCWGENDTYELGQGGTAVDDIYLPVPVKAGVGGFLSGVVQLSAQDGHFCALKSDTTVACWGRGISGQLGDGGSTNLSLATSVWTGSQNLSGVRKISAGGAFSCALMQSGGVKCWGSDASGQMGNGPGGPSPLPVDVTGISNAVDIGAGGDTACALLADSSMRCWGSNAYGQVGNGDAPTDANVPQSVLSGVSRIGVGFETTCAQMIDSSLKCWGEGGDGQFLESARVDKSLPTTIPGVSGFIQIAQNFERTICVLYRGGAASCWGNNSDQKIGIPGDAGNDVLVPATLPQDLVTLAYPGEGTSFTSPVKTKLDKKKKTYTLTTQLTTTPNLLVSPAEACAGATAASVKYSYTSFKTVKSKGKKKRKKVKKSKTIKKNGALALSGASCVSTLALKLPVKYLNAKKPTVTFTYAGNASLQPISTSAKFKLPKVKIKKKKSK